MTKKSTGTSLNILQKKVLPKSGKCSKKYSVIHCCKFAESHSTGINQIQWRTFWISDV